jgi:hypothetical protein
MINSKTLKNNIAAIALPTDKSISRTWLPSELAPFVEKLFTHPYGWSDGIFRTPLLWVSEYLKKKGVAPINIRAGLLTYLCLNSVKLGFPLSVILTSEDKTIAFRLLLECMKIAPNNSFREVQGLKVEELYKDREFYKNKVLICHDISTIKKALPDILRLITEGYSEHQAHSMSKFGGGMQKFIAQHPKALIGIEKTNGAQLINHPSIIKVPVDINCCHDEIASSIFSNSTTNISNTERRTVATIFERLGNRKVSIPYPDQIVRAIAPQKPKNFYDKLRLIKKVISLCTIVNDPPQLTSIEFFAKYIGVRSEEIYQTMGKEGIRSAQLPSAINIIEANKVDYYISAMLLDGVIGITSDSFTDAQIKIFKAVKLINFHKLKGAAINQNNELKKLSMLPRFPAYWAYMHELLKILNKPNRFTMPVPFIEKTLAQLKQHKMLGIKKGESTKGNGFFILVPKINSYIKMPALPDIIDPNDQGQVIKVLNPLTGSVEEL